MKSRTPITLFPFLSVLVSTMGVLSLLAVTFSMFAGPDAGKTKGPPPRQVDVRWTGAPPSVRPLLVECRAGGATIHGAGDIPTQFFTLQALKREAQIVREMQDAGMSQLALGSSRQTLWFFFKSTLDAERRLNGSFTLIMHQIELSNMTGDNRRKQEERYPILLVYADGVESYDIVSYLLETTSRLSTGVEPMLPGWVIPYRNQRS